MSKLADEPGTKQKTKQTLKMSKKNEMKRHKDM